MNINLYLWAIKWRTLFAMAAWCTWKVARSWPVLASAVTAWCCNGWCCRCNYASWTKANWSISIRFSGTWFRRARTVTGCSINNINANNSNENYKKLHFDCFSFKLTAKPSFIELKHILKSWISFKAKKRMFY